MQDFLKLDVWQRSHSLTLDVYRLTRAFPREELYGLTSQLRRASSSIPANIAEGCGRGSPADMARCLQIAMGSASEVQYLLILCRDLAYIEGDESERMLDVITGTKRMLASLIQKVRAGA